MFPSKYGCSGFFEMAAKNFKAVANELDNTNLYTFWLLTPMAYSFQTAKMITDSIVLVSWVKGCLFSRTREEMDETMPACPGWQPLVSHH